MHVVTQDVPIDDDLYWRLIAELGPEPIPGHLLHLCTRRPDGGLSYTDVWESEEAWARALRGRLHDALSAAFGGNRPPGDPVMQHSEVVNATGSLLAGDNASAG